MIVAEILSRLAGIFSDTTPLIPYYHVVCNERLAHIYHLHPYKNERQFMCDIDFFCRRYHPISLEDLIDFARHNKKLKKNSFIFTFDDGYSQIYSIVAPILFKKGIPAIFFLVSDFIDNKKIGYKNKASILIEHLLSGEKKLHSVKTNVRLQNDIITYDDLSKRIMKIGFKNQRMLDEFAASLGVDFNQYLLHEKPYVTKDQIRILIKMGFSIGAHSMDHPLYQDLSLQEQLDQTLGSLIAIKGAFDLPYSVFAFPHSDQSIQRDFFVELEKHLDLTFGTGGLKRSTKATHFPRINFERSLEPAPHILAKQLLKRWLR